MQTKSMTGAILDSTVEEFQLVQRTAEGNQEAFQTLFDKYHLEIYRFCVLMLGIREAAEDIYQETFLAFYDLCRRKKEISNVHGLLLTIARNKCLNFLKATARNIPLESIPEPTERPDIEVIDLESHLQNALLQIPEQYREALLLFEVEGYNYREIAAQLDISLHVVKNRIYYAKRALRILLQPLLFPDHITRTDER